MKYRALNVFDSRNAVVVEYEAMPGLLGMMLGMQSHTSMARGQKREWVEERAQSMTQLTEHKLRGAIIDFLEKTYADYKQSEAPAATA